MSSLNVQYLLRYRCSSWNALWLPKSSNWISVHWPNLPKQHIPWHATITTTTTAATTLSVFVYLASFFIRVTELNRTFVIAAAGVYRMDTFYWLTRMWANDQRDGRPVEHRWRPLFNAAVWLTPTTRCRAVTLPRCETHWNLQGCLKLPDGSQPLVGCSPYCGDMWRTYRCLTSFFLTVDTCHSCKDIARQTCAMVPRWRFLATFLCPAFPASRVQQVSDLHLKFALRPHNVWKYGRHPIYGRWD